MGPCGLVSITTWIGCRGLCAWVCVFVCGGWTVLGGLRMGAALTKGAPKLREGAAVEDGKNTQCTPHTELGKMC